MSNKRPNVGNMSQSEKFKEAAREIEADEREDAFEENLRRIASQKPKQKEEAPDK